MAVAAFRILQYLIDPKYLPKHASNNVMMLARMRVYGRCAHLLHPRHYVEGEEEAFAQGNPAISATL